MQHTIHTLWHMVLQMPEVYIMTQITLEGKNIPLWKIKAERNTQPRMKWQLILGETLTSRITRDHKNGLTEEQIYDGIVEEFPYLLNKAKENLKISISARLSEQKSLLKRLNG
jgi:hypothetical protein